MTPSSEDRTKMRLFVRKAEEVARILKRVKADCPKPGIRISWKTPRSSVWCTQNFPEEDLLRSLLMAVRSLYAQGEPICFPRICNGLWKYLDANDQIVVDNLRAAYKRVLNHIGPRDIFLKYKDEKLMPHEILDLYINARYFHTEEEKVFKLEHVEDSDIPIAKWLMICTVTSLAEIFVALNGVIAKYL